jgi:hypothetical protein
MTDNKDKFWKVYAVILLVLLIIVLWANRYYYPIAKVDIRINRLTGTLEQYTGAEWDKLSWESTSGTTSTGSKKP